MFMGNTLSLPLPMWWLVTTWQTLKSVSISLNVLATLTLSAWTQWILYVQGTAITCFHFKCKCWLSINLILKIKSISVLVQSCLASAAYFCVVVIWFFFRLNVLPHSPFHCPSDSISNTFAMRWCEKVPLDGDSRSCSEQCKFEKRNLRLNCEVGPSLNIPLGCFETVKNTLHKNNNAIFSVF